MEPSKKFEGVYTNLSNDDYHAEKAHMSSSNLKMLLKDTEKFYQEKVLGKKENIQKNAFDEGNYAHALILEPELIEDDYAFFPGFRKSGKDWEQFKESNGGKIILSKPQKARVEKWFEAYKQRPEAVELITKSKPEVSLFTELAGVPIKVRADALSVEHGFIADVKTTAYNPEIDSFKLVVENLKYDLSAALYYTAFEKKYGKPFDFYFIVLGKKDIICEVYKASRQTLDKGNLEVMEALNIYKKRLESGDWSNGVKSLTLDVQTNYEIQEI